MTVIIIIISFIVVGIVCDFRLGYGRVLSRKSKIIAINRSYDQLHKVNWKMNSSANFLDTLFVLFTHYCSMHCIL